MLTLALLITAQAPTGIGALSNDFTTEGALVGAAGELVTRKRVGQKDAENPQPAEKNRRQKAVKAEGQRSEPNSVVDTGARPTAIGAPWLPWAGGLAGTAITLGWIGFLTRRWPRTSLVLLVAGITLLLCLSHALTR